MASTKREISQTLETDPVLTTDELAAYLKCARSVAYRLLWSGEIPSFKRGRSRRVRRSAVDAWIREQEQRS